MQTEHGFCLPTNTLSLTEGQARHPNSESDVRISDADTDTGSPQPASKRSKHDAALMPGDYKGLTPMCPLLRKKHLSCLLRRI